MDIFVQVLLLALGFVMLVKGADWFVDGASGIADRFGIPQLVIGLTIVAMGTSAPEAAVSITAALKGTADIAIGNVVGSNIINVLIILGLAAAITPIAVAKSTIRYEIPFMLVITLLLMGFGYLGGSVNLWEGIVLWVLFIAYLLYMSAGYNPLPGASGAQEGGFLIFYRGIFAPGQISMAMLVWRFVSYYLSLLAGAGVLAGQGIWSCFWKRGQKAADGQKESMEE